MVVERTKHITPGGWRTIEVGWNTDFWLSFYLPKSAQIKVRYGAGWIFGRDSQKQTLDGVNVKILTVGGGSVIYARVQVYVKYPIDIAYKYYPGPYDGLSIPLPTDFPS